MIPFVTYGPYLIALEIKGLHIKRYLNSFVCLAEEKSSRYCSESKKVLGVKKHLEELSVGEYPANCGENVWGIPDGHAGLQYVQWLWLVSPWLTHGHTDSF